MPWTDGDFYGEALPIDNAKDVTGDAVATGSTKPGDTVGEALTYLYFDNHTLTASSGDSFLASVYPDWYYLQPTSLTVFTLVIELATGSSGTFRIKSGTDPDWNLTSASLATNDCGTFTAVPGRILVPVSNFTTSLMYNYEAQPLFLVEVLTGTVVIKQMRLRMWPPGGPLGNWANEPDFTTTTTAVRYHVSGPGQVAITSEPEHVQAIGSGGWGPEVNFVGPSAFGGYPDTADGPHNPPFVSMVTDLASNAATIDNYKWFVRRNYDSYDPLIRGSYAYGWNLVQLPEPSHDFSGRYATQCVLYLYDPSVETSRPTASTYNDPDRIPWENCAGFRSGTTKGDAVSQFNGWGGTGPTLTALTTSTDTPSHAAANISVKITALSTRPVFETESMTSPGVYQVLSSTGVPSGLGTGAVYDTASHVLALPAAPNVMIELAPNYMTTPPSSYTEFTYSGSVGTNYTDGQREINVLGVTSSNLFADAEYFDPSLPWTGDGLDPTPETPGGSGVVPSWVDVFGSTGGSSGGNSMSTGDNCIDCGRLGVGTHRVFLYDRGGARRIAEITDLALVRWGRVRDDISSATVIVNGPSRECCAILSAIAVGRHEIVIFRNNDRVWEGPITRINWKATSVEITGHDICHYISRTIMRSAYDNRYAKKNSKVGPVTTRAQVILQNELRRKESLTPSYNILRFLDVRTTPQTTKTSRFTPPYASTVWEEMDYMAARLSLDYTVLGRRLIISDVHDLLGRSQLLTDKDFSDELIVSSYGMELATRSAVTDGEGHWAAVGGIDPFYGEVELLNNTYGEEARPANPTQPTKEEIAALVKEMTSQAQRNLSGRYPIPTVVRVPDNTQLSPSAPICINGLVPGIRVPIRTTLACLDLQQEQKLDSMTCQQDSNGESVTITLSPAPGTTPWDDSSETSGD